MKLLKKIVKQSINQMGYDIRKIHQSNSSNINFHSNAVTDPSAISPVNEGYPNKKFFIVTCYGLSASNWFAHALNINPEITCTHSEESLLAHDKLYSEEYLPETVYERYKARMSRKHKSIDQFFSSVIWKGNTPVVGGVHTHRLSDLQEIETQFTSKIKYKLMNLVRHPVTLVNSGAGHLKYLFSFDIYMIAGLLGSIQNESDFFFKLASDYKINLADKEVQSFIGGCTNLFDLGRDYKTSYKPFSIKMESLTSDRDYYKDIVGKLVQNQIEISDEYLDSVFKIGVVNQHKYNEIKQAQDYYAEWLPWQKECFHFCLKKSGILSHYLHFGYDFSFLPDNI